MHMVRVETKEQLKELIEWVFFRSEGDPKPPAKLTLDDICYCLQVDIPAIVSETFEQFSPEWYGAYEDFDLAEHVLRQERLPILQDFKPGTLVWKIADDFDRGGHTQIRVFIYAPDGEITFDNFLKERAEYRAEHDELMQLHERMMEAEANAQNT